MNPILKQLEESRVLLELKELCDGFFEHYLDKSDLLQLISELTIISKEMVPWNGGIPVPLAGV